MDATRSRFLLIAGLIFMVAGVIDPLEGSIVVLAGSAIAAAGAYFGHLPRARGVIVAFFVMAIGVAALFGFSAAGGVGGNSGRSIWWIGTMLPYPFGWLAAMAATVLCLRASRRATA